MISKPDILSAKILIVDDQEANVLILERMLLDEGYTCIASTMRPHEVCPLYRQNSYDLILLDLEMPGMDGFQVLEGLKKIEPDDYLPVLVITGQSGHKLRALQAGAKDFVTKPFDPVEVQTRIHNMLEVRLLYKRLENYNKQLEQIVAERTAELRESEARFRHLTELASDWYWEQDENGHFTKVYGPVLEMLGITVGTLLGESKGNDGARWNEAEYATFKANITARLPFIDFVYSRTKSDGSRQYLMVSGEPMFAASGIFTGYRGIGRDVTKSMHSAQLR
ncbi:response regulator [Nitrosospira sp. Nsp13]|jgi:PAS domain S-box-containing protein|uniref:response regulator n=1 Tax=Nitrosospira sp. Nsp13 TaxID=1855332 RepID=UPI0008804A06|nr:response regulator [Nitrosospira sp. Nsp13]SCY58178.1 PAS domain S-box-containing protein [Nitrosospira sp. Nsp13]